MTNLKDYGNSLFKVKNYEKSIAIYEKGLE